MNNDSHETIFPADPRITAYALGELEGDELKLIEAAVAADPVLQDAVNELRAFGDNLALTLLREPLPPVDAQPLPDGGITGATGSGIGGLLAKLSPVYYLTGGLAAAGFAVLVAVRTDSGQPTSRSEEKPVIMELVSGPGDETSAKDKKPAAVAVAAKSLDVSTVRFDESLAAGGGAPEMKTMDQDIAHRVQAARQAAASPVASPVSDTRLFSAADNSLQMPAMPDLPSVGASSVGGMGFGKGVGAVGTGTGHITGSAGGSALAASAAHRPSLGGSFLRMDGQAPMGALARSEAYGHPGDNSYRTVAAEPLSTFSVDVDTASYSNVRRFLTGGRMPPRDAVRVEELVNYFPYRYAPPAAAATKPVPFAAHLEVASAPWAPAHRLVRIGIKGRELTAGMRPAANLVFLLDVSGSMNSANKLPLVKESLRLLVDRLRSDDRVAIVTYAGSSGLALPSTPVSKKAEILAALDNLNASGSTNGAMGIHLAYDIAKANIVAGGVNRVILCTDGDFNVGVTDRGELVGLIQEKAKSRVFLSVFGFGMGNYKDAMLESLADKGNGAYGYIDTRREAEKVFVEQAEGTLATIAKDVKIQVEFNPARVQSYRLIGYENRMLAKEDFNNDAVDAGDIGAGHTVTALYEVVPVGVESDGSVRPAVDPLKYQKTEGGSRKTQAGGRKTGSEELLTVKIRYKEPEGDVSAKQEFPLVDAGKRFEQASGEFQFASAVAAWGMLLRNSPDKGSATFEQVLAWAENGLGEDTDGHRAEFIQLVRRSAELK